MATQTRAPTSDNSTAGTIAYSSGTTGYNLVSTYPNTADPLTSYVTLGTTANSAILFNFTAFSIPTGSTSISVAVEYYDEEASTGANTSDGYLRVGNSNYASGTTHNPSTTTTSRSKTFANNPKTSAAWTVAQINGTDGTNDLQAFGVIGPDSNPVWRIGAIRCTVTYTPAAQTLTPSLFSDSNSLAYAHTVTTATSLTQSSVFTNSASLANTHVVTTGPVTLTQASTFTNSNSLAFSHTLAHDDKTLTQSSSFTNTPSLSYEHQVVQDQSLTQSASYLSSSNFFAHQADLGLEQANLFQDSSSFFSASLTSLVTLAQDSSYSNSPSLAYQHTVTPGTVTLPQSDIAPNDATFFEHLLEQGAAPLTLVPDRYDNGPTFFTQALTTQTNLIQTATVSNTATFFLQDMLGGDLTQVSVFTNGNTFYEHGLLYDQTLEVPVLFENNTSFVEHVVRRHLPDVAYVLKGLVYGNPDVPLTGELEMGFDGALKLDVTSGKLVKVINNKVALTF